MKRVIGFMAIRMVGLSHTDTDIEIRERCTFKKSEAEEALLRLKNHPMLKGSILLSTCNRTELWVETKDEDDGYNIPICHGVTEAIAMDKEKQDAVRMKDTLRSQANERIDGRDDLLTMIFSGLKDTEGIDLHLEERSDDEAVRYLFELTAGLHSQIIGEDQILTQVREAAALSRELEASSKTLDVLFRMAVTSAKKVKTQVQMPRANASLAGAAIDYLHRTGHMLKDKQVLVIGNGMMGKLTAQLLMEEGAKVTVTVRQYHSGLVEIPQGANRIDYGKRYEILPACDYCFSATASPNLTIKKEQVGELKLEHDVTFIDLAMPRDIERNIAELPHVSLIGMEDLKTTRISDELQIALDEARKIVNDAVAEYVHWYGAKDLVTQIDEIAKAASKDLLWRLNKAFKQDNLQETLQIEDDKSEIAEEKKYALKNEFFVQDAEELKEQIGIAASKVIKKLLFSLRDELDPETLKECLRVMEDSYKT